LSWTLPAGELSVPSREPRTARGASPEPQTATRVTAVAARSAQSVDRSPSPARIFLRCW
jgi:hypothetical protein